MRRHIQTIGVGGQRLAILIKNEGRIEKLAIEAHIAEIALQPIKVGWI